MTYGTFTDARDGQVYKTVKIGNQVWMAENLRYKADGSRRSYEKTFTEEEYGRLYTWEQAMKACPKGWHLPSDEEWKELELHLGMSEEEVNKMYWRGDIASKLKSTSGWLCDSRNGNGDNSSGFNLIPTYDSTHRSRLADETRLWTSTENEDRAYSRQCYSYHTEFCRGLNWKEDFYCVRLVRNV